MHKEKRDAEDWNYLVLVLGLMHINTDIDSLKSHWVDIEDGWQVTVNRDIHDGVLFVEVRLCGDDYDVYTKDCDELYDKFAYEALDLFLDEKAEIEQEEG